MNTGPVTSVDQKHPGGAQAHGASTGSARRMASAMVLIVCLLAAVLQGCAATNSLWRAQEAFNEASALENALAADPLHLESGTAGTVTRSAGARAKYEQAQSELETLSASEEKQLRADGLWGNLLTLRALTAWRLGEYDQAREAARKARLEPGLLHPRDTALIAALPGLIKIDEAYAKIYRNDLPETTSRHKHFQNLRSLLTSAFSDIDRARELVHSKHPVQSYLLQAQLAGYVNLLNGYTLWSDQPNAIPTDAERDRARVWLCTLNELLLTDGDSYAVSPERIRSFVRGWAHRTGLSVTDCPR